MLREDIPAGKLRACFHQFDERFLSIRTDKGYITEVDDQLPTLKLAPCVPPSSLHFRGPGTSQFALENQPPLAVRFYDGDFEHYFIRLIGSVEAMQRPNGTDATISVNR